MPITPTHTAAVEALAVEVFSQFMRALKAGQFDPRLARDAHKAAAALRVVQEQGA